MTFEKWRVQCRLAIIMLERVRAIDDIKSVRRMAARVLLCGPCSLKLSGKHVCLRLNLKGLLLFTGVRFDGVM